MYCNSGQDRPFINNPTHFSYQSISEVVIETETFSFSYSLFPSQSFSVIFTLLLEMYAGTYHLAKRVRDHLNKI